MRLRSSTANGADAAVRASSADAGDDRLRAILVSTNAIDLVQLDQIDALREQTGRTFGDAAVHLGVVSQDAVDRATARQHDAKLLVVGDSTVSPAVVAAYDLFDPLAEKLRALRASVVTPAQMASNPPRIIVISSVSGSDTPGIASNFAVVVAQLGYDGLLVDANLSSPTQHHLFGLPNRDGVSSLLSQGVEGIRCLSTPIPHLDLLPAGNELANVAEAFERTSLCQSLRNLRRAYQFIIVDGGTQPPEVAAALSRGSDGVLMVAERGHTQLKRLKQAIMQMESREVDVLGTILAR